MARVYNFSAGPSVLPETVLQQAAGEMLCYGNSGMSVMEMSHRSNDFEEIIYHTEDLIRELMSIPPSYKVFFLQGGASLQFSMVPLNLLTKSKKADYVITGVWAKKAFIEAGRYGQCRAVASSEDKTFSYIPKLNADVFDSQADYFHICLNNTIYGTKFPSLPETRNVPLVADISSCILSEPLEVSRFGLLYAGAQKNLGPAGVTVVIVRDDLIGDAQPCTPTMLQYKTHIADRSMYNTPPTYAVYICGLVLSWIKNLGGVGEIAKINRKKADLLYSYLDSSRLFSPTVSNPDRSIMNVCFVTGHKEIDKKFISEAAQAGFVSLSGHRSVGGMRASLYNAMPIEGVEKLVEFMSDFEKRTIS